MEKIQRRWVLVVMVVVAASSRLLPHPPNFTPVMAIALFSGAFFTERWMRYSVPILAMVASDAVIGFHSTLPVVYASELFLVWMGSRYLREPRPGKVLVLSLTGSVLFFVTTNLAVWGFSGFYSKDLAGLASCFVAAIPFFENSVTGDLLYSLGLFGGFVLLSRSFPQRSIHTRLAKIEKR